MVRFLWTRAIKQHAALIVSMPSDRNGSKASLPHGFDVICGPVVGIKRAVGGDWSSPFWWTGKLEHHGFCLKVE